MTSKPTYAKLEKRIAELEAKVESADALAEAAQQVIDNWSQGDLAGAVNGLEGTLENYREVKPCLTR